MVRKRITRQVAKTNFNSMRSALFCFVFRIDNPFGCTCQVERRVQRCRHILLSFFWRFSESRHLANPDALADTPYPFQVRFVRRVPETDVRAQRLLVRLPIENHKLTILANDEESVEFPAEQRFCPTIGLQAAEAVRGDAPGQPGQFVIYLAWHRRIGRLTSLRSLGQCDVLFKVTILFVGLNLN